MGIKEGDKLIIEVERMADLNWRLWYIKGLQGVFSDVSLEKLQKYDETEAYNKGLQDAWEAAGKLIKPSFDGGIPLDDIDRIFCSSSFTKIFDDIKASQAIERIKAYETKKAEEQEIRVGDEVRHKEHRDLKIIVTAIAARTSTIHGMNNEGFPIISNNIEKWEKTGKHYDEIERLFKGDGDEKISF